MWVIETTHSAHAYWLPASSGVTSTCTSEKAPSRRSVSASSSDSEVVLSPGVHARTLLGVEVTDRRVVVEALLERSGKDQRAASPVGRHAPADPDSSFALAVANSWSVSLPESWRLGEGLQLCDHVRLLTRPPSAGR